MSQESTKEPAFVLEGGCCFVAAVYTEKEPETMDASELAPFFSGFFFVLPAETSQSKDWFSRERNPPLPFGR